MAETFELYSLTSRLTMDTAQFDRAYQSSRPKMQTLAGDYNKLSAAADKYRAGQGRLTQALGGLNTSLSSLGGPLGNVSGQVTSLSSAFVGLPGPIGLAGAAIGAFAVGSIAAATTIYNLVTSVSEATGKFIDLSQQTGFSVETLSALANAAETSGGSIDTVTGALGIFEQKMQEAKEKGSEMSKIFKALEIDNTNHEKALRQALDALTRLSTAEEQATAGKKLFGRAYKDLLAAIKEVGSFDEYLNQQLQKGTLITTDAAKAGDVLSDSVTEMGRAFEAVRRIVADQFGPDVLKTIQSITQFLEENRHAAGAWAQDWLMYFKDAASGAQLLIEAINQLNAGLGTLFGWGIPEILKFLSPGALSSLTDALAAVGASSRPPGPNAAYDRWASGAFPAQVDPLAAGLRPVTGTNPFLQRLSLPVGGGGRGGGGRSRQRDAGVDYLKQLEEQLKSLTPRTALQTAQERLLNKEFDKTSDAVKKKIQITAADMDLQKMVLEITRERRVATKSLSEEMEELARTIREAGEAGLQFFSRRRTMRDLTDVDLYDLGGGSGRVRNDPATRPRSIADGASRNRIATVTEQVRRDQLAIWQDEINRLADDLTFTIDDAISEGFRSGIKAGVITFGLGILDMARHEALGQLQKAIADALFGAASGTSGGGFFSKLLNIGLSALLGGIGGGGAGGLGSAAAGAIGGRAGGGNMSPNSWSWVGEYGPELVKAGPRGLSVMSTQESLGMGSPVFNFTVYANDAQSFARRETQHQITSRTLRGMRQAA